MKQSLHEELRKFLAWRGKGAPDILCLGHGAEWESNYPDWPDLLSATSQAINSTDMDQEDVEALLFVLARDNEDENVAGMLAAAPETLTRVLPSALANPDPDARWQIAMILPKALGERAREYLTILLKDSDQYVRRRATAALTELDPASDQEPASH